MNAMYDELLTVFLYILWFAALGCVSVVLWFVWEWIKYVCGIIEPEEEWPQDPAEGKRGRF